MSDSVDPLARLLARLDLEQTGPDRFGSSATGGMRRLFGGLIAAQCAVAAMRTVEAGRLHALHGFFLRAGRGGAGLHFDVTRTRDGRSFSARRVVAMQGADAIFECLASFTTHADGIEHAAEPALDPALAAGPEGLPDWESVRAAETGEPARTPDAIEVRVVRPEEDRPDATPPASRAVWMRVRGALPDDPCLHAAVLVYASDRTLLRTAARMHGGMRSRLPASLDHAVWLHRTPRLDGWWIYASETPIATEARALVHGRMLTPDGVRFASVAQEGLLRRKKPLDV
ncbi:MAG: thioesterase family protein [Myxococcota bacterium]|jgi:acyl-CoA thioesterase-2|nr:thioesterase family protein [Myxococcota bacterium]